MQKIFLYALVLFCFFTPKEALSEQQMGWFFGAGLGGGLEKVQAESTGIQKSIKNYASFLASAKVGRYHYFTQRIGLRYYYNFDLSFNSGNPHSSPFSDKTGFFFITQAHTLNADAIFNAYSKEDHTFSLIGGIGLGLAIQDYAPRFETRYGFDERDSNRFTAKFQARINLGARWMLKQKYGVEFIAKIPFTSGMVIENLNREFNNKIGKTTTYPYYFTFNFITEL